MPEINIDITIDNAAPEVEVVLNETPNEVNVTLSQFSTIYVLKAGDTMSGKLVFDDASIEGVGHVTFDTTHEDEAEAVGSLYWNNIDGTLNLQLTETEKAELFQKEMFYGKAVGSISRGDLVQFAGVQGDHILIKRVVAAEVVESPEYFVGVAKSNLTNGQFGYVVWFGKLDGIKTTGWAAGDVLYFDNVTGQFTNVKPSSNEVTIIIAAVIKQSTGNAFNGAILIRPQLKINGNGIYEATLGNYTTVTIPKSTIGISTIKNVQLTNSSGKEVSVSYSITNTDLIIESNINLNNHKLIVI